MILESLNSQTMNSWIYAVYYGNTLYSGETPKCGPVGVEVTCTKQNHNGNRLFGNFRPCVMFDEINPHNLRQHNNTREYMYVGRNSSH